MKIHPFIEHIRYRVIASLILIVTFITQVLLLRFYGEGSLSLVVFESLAFLTVFSVLGYYSWYTISFLDTLQKQAGVILLVVLLCLAASHLVVFSVEPESGNWYLRSIPLRIVFCIMGWVILFQWYNYYSMNEVQEEITQSAEPDTEEADEEVLPLIDRVTVKDGSRIHIIPLEELVYIQASGDYITFFTADKQFIKEQTMKSLVSQLPGNFVRIHRSTIVNSYFIARIELFEKQSYRLRLKNGLYIKVSTAGYKLLKEQLKL